MAVMFLVLPSISHLWFLSGLLGICANLGFGALAAAMNADLPNLATKSPEALKIVSKPVSPWNEDHVGSPLIHHAPFEDVEALKARYDSELFRVMSRISYPCPSHPAAWRA